MKSQIISVAAVLAQLSSASLYGESNLNHSCVLSKLPVPGGQKIPMDADNLFPGPKLLSCSPPTLAANVSKVLDTCCVETFGGLLLSTQFWDTYTGLESQGQKLPKDSWTLHGMWPDFCNGSFTQYCDLSRQYDPVPSPNTTNGLRNGDFLCSKTFVES